LESLKRNSWHSCYYTYSNKLLFVKPQEISCLRLDYFSLSMSYLYFWNIIIMFDQPNAIFSWQLNFISFLIEWQPRNMISMRQWVKIWGCGLCPWFFSGFVTRLDKTMQEENFFLSVSYPSAGFFYFSLMTIEQLIPKCVFSRYSYAFSTGIFTRVFYCCGYFFCYIYTVPFQVCVYIDLVAHCVCLHGKSYRWRKNEQQHNKKEKLSTW